MAVRIRAITKPEGDERYEAISHYWANNDRGVLIPLERNWFIDWLDANGTTLLYRKMVVKHVVM